MVAGHLTGAALQLASVAIGYVFHDVSYEGNTFSSQWAVFALEMVN